MPYFIAAKGNLLIIGSGLDISEAIQDAIDSHGNNESQFTILPCTMNALAAYKIGVKQLAYFDYNGNGILDLKKSKGLT